MRNKNEENRVAQKGRSLRSGAGFVASTSRKALSVSRLHKAITSVIFSGLLPSLALAGPSDQSDLTQLPFEQLLNTNIVTAAKLAKQVSEASSAVSIVTADDIRAYGYRTLGDILRSMRGLTTTFDSGGYSYLSGRGVGVREFSGRISMLIDGQMATDSIFGQSYFEGDGLLDVELIDRVEFIPGGGSAMYGNGAFLGVINVITKHGKDFDGTQVAQEFGSHKWNKSRLTYGKTFDNGLDLLVSGSSYSNRGRLALDKSQVDSQVSSGVEERVNLESNHRLFVKAGFEGWGFEAGWARHPVSQAFAGLYSREETTFASVHYDTQASPTLKVSVKASFGDYSNQAWTSDWAVRDSQIGRWRGLDTKFVGTWFEDHTLVFGLEHRDDFKQRISPSDLQVWATQFDPAWTLPTYDTNTRTESFYLYDAYDLSKRLELNYGFRYDRVDNGRESVSPRAALIFKPRSSTVLKLSTGISNRQLSASDRYWAYNNNTNLYTGEISSGQVLPTDRVLLNEFVWEEQLGPATRWLASVYRYRNEGRSIITSIDPAFLHRKILSQGFETEFEHGWEDGTRLKASYTWQDSISGTGFWVLNSPRHLAHLNFTTPIVGEKLRLGVEVQGVGQRQEEDANAYWYRKGGYSVTNLTLSSSQLLPGWSASFSVRNVFNRSYEDSITMDGRNIWLQLSHDFK